MCNCMYAKIARDWTFYDALLLSNQIGNSSKDSIIVMAQQNYL